MFLDKIIENNQEVLAEDVVMSDMEVIMEGLLEDAGLGNFDEEEIMALVECGLLSERSIVRLDKNAHKSRAAKKAALNMAKTNGDPAYKKLVNVYKMKKALIEKIMTKYGTKAESEVRKMKFNAKGRIQDVKENKKVANAVKKVLDKNSAKKSTDI
jgi:NCAIR mutase (PurE)-related protein